MTRPRASWWVLAGVSTFLAWFGLLLSCDLYRPESERMSLEPRGTGLLVSGVVEGGAAWRAGLRDGDEILQAKGRRVRSRLDWAAVTSTFRFGEPTRLEVLHQGRPAIMWLRQGRAPWTHWLTPEGAGLLVSRLVQAITLALALLIVVRRPRDHVALLGAWVLSALGVFCVVLPYRSMEVWQNVPFPVREALWFPFGSTLVLGALLLSFFLSFPVRRVRSTWGWALVWLPMLVAIVPHARFHATVLYRPRAPLPPDGLIPLIVASFAYVAATALVVAWSYRSLTDETERRRLRVLVAGVSFAMAGVAAVAGYWTRTGQLALFGSPVVGLVSLAMLVVPVSFAYAILRHRLFGLGLILRLGVRYALARRLLRLLVPVLLAVVAADLYLHRDQVLSQLVAGRAVAYSSLIGFALLAQSRRERWMDALDRRFFRERYDAQRILRQVADDIHRSEGFEQGAARVAAQVHVALHPAFVGVLLRTAGDAAYRGLACVPPGEGPSSLPAEGVLVSLVTVLGGPLQVAGDDEGGPGPLTPDEAAIVKASRMELLVPIAGPPGGASAVMVLGPRRSEEPYAAEDRALLESIATGLSFLLVRPASTQAASPTTLAECPSCGACYDAGSGDCPADGQTLLPSQLPRVLAGRYRVDRRLGRGGMGVVFLALDEALDRDVAVKVLREELLGDRDAVERFQREARLAARFSHPHVVTVHDFGISPGNRAFLVMERLDGITLREEIDRHGRLSPRRTLAVLGPVCDAVAAAHRRYLVHRDLKPENVMLAVVEGIETPKVLDFGIAKATGVGAAALGRETGTGRLLGTPQYMAPEQLRGETVCAAWDVWSLAVMAFEMLTGDLPVPCSAFASLASGVAGGADARLAQARGALKDGERMFFERALAIDPSARPQTADQLCRELAQALGAGEAG